MSRRTNHPGVALLLAATAVWAGCGDSTGIARDYDPYITLDRLEDVLVPMQEGEELLLTLDLAVSTLNWYDANTFAALLSPRPDRTRSLRAALGRPDARGRAETPAPASVGSGAPAGTEALSLPTSVRGRTLFWDAVEGYVPGSRSGAPSNGVRMVLYRMDPYTGYPSSPLTEVGYLDLIDADFSGGEAIRVVAVRTSGPDRVIADYRVQLTWNGTADNGGMEVRGEGAFGDAAVLDIALYERLTWSRSQNRDELRLDHVFRRGGQSVSLSGRATSRFEAYEWETFDFAVGFRGGGDDVDIDAEIEPDGSLRGEIRSDGRLAVRIGGYDGHPTFERPRDELSWSELDTLDAVWTGISDLIWWSDWLLVPQEVLYLDG